MKQVFLVFAIDSLKRPVGIMDLGADSSGNPSWFQWNLDYPAEVVGLDHYPTPEELAALPPFAQYTIDKILIPVSSSDYNNTPLSPNDPNSPSTITT